MHFSISGTTASIHGKDTCQTWMFYLTLARHVPKYILSQTNDLLYKNTCCCRIYWWWDWCWDWCFWTHCSHVKSQYKRKLKLILICTHVRVVRCWFNCVPPKSEHHARYKTDSHERDLISNKLSVCNNTCINIWSNLLYEARTKQIDCTNLAGIMFQFSVNVWKTMFQSPRVKTSTNNECNWFGDVAGNPTADLNLYMYISVHTFI